MARKGIKELTSRQIAERAEDMSDENLIDLSKQIANSLPIDITKGKRRKILGVMMLPQYHDLSNKRCCQLANISRAGWCKAQNDEKFKSAIIRATTILKGQYALPVLQAFIRNALKGGAYGYGDTTAQLRYLNDQKVLKPEKFEHDVKDVTDLSDDELGEYIDERCQRIKNSKTRGKA